jgi:hypothetical protein
MRTTTGLVLAIGILTASSRARADDPLAPAVAAPTPKLEGQGNLLSAGDVTARKPGWDYHLQTGATVAVSDNRSVVGQVDGTSFAFGFKFEGALANNTGPHEWRSNLNVAGNVTHTPAIPQWIKGVDLFNLETIYLYHIIEPFGLFGRATMRTPMFNGTDVRPIPTQYAIAHVDGTVQNVLATELHLSDPFRPLTLTQSAGVFYQPYRSKQVNVEFRFGPGAQEAAADHQLSVTDDPTTLTIVEISELANFAQLGPELDATIWGEVPNQKITYRIEADTMIPLAHSSLPPGDNRNSLDLTNFSLLAQLSVHALAWASLDYDFRLVREPQLVDATQVQNNLLFSIGITVPEPKPKEPPPCAPAPPPPPVVVEVVPAPPSNGGNLHLAP